MDLNLMLRICQEFYDENPMMITTLVILFLVYVYYRVRVVHLPLIYCRDNSGLHRVLKSLPVLREQYFPTFWCWESRLQSLVSTFVRNLLISDIQYRRQVFTFSDGGEVGLDWATTDHHQSPHQPIVLILPGITGCSQSEYVKSLVNVSLTEVNARCVVFNFRGRGGLGLKNPRTYSAANTEDLAEIVEFLNQNFPEAPVIATGVSLGGIILGNYLAAQGEKARSKLLAAVLISVCFDTFEGSKSLEKPGLNLLLNRHLATSLVESIKEVKEHFVSNKKWDLEQVFSSTTVREFDSRFTTKMFGYKDVVEYYAAARLYHKVENIKVPTMAINAEDDPFQPGDSIPKEGAARSSHLAIVTTQYGGHVGFVDGFLPTGYFFSDRLFSQFARAALTQLHDRS